MVVIQHQRHLAGRGPGGQLVDQRRHQPLERRRRRRPEQRAHALADTGAHPIQRRHRWRQNRAGSLSPSSSDNQATGRWPRRAQSTSKAVLPDPAGAQTSTRPRPSPSSSRSASRGLGTKPGRGPGTCSLVASRTSGSPSATADAAAAARSIIADLHAYRLQRSPVPLLEGPGRPMPRTRAALTTYIVYRYVSRRFTLPNAGTRQTGSSPARAERHFRARCRYGRFHLPCPLSGDAQATWPA